MAGEKNNVLSPTLHPQPRSAVPSHLLNGSSPLRNTSSTTTRAQERDRLASSIQSTYNRRTSIDPAELSVSRLNLDGENSRSWVGMPGKTAPEHAISETAPDDETQTGPSKPVLQQEPMSDARDHAPPTPPVSASRPASPYTLNPPIDFDGLSWPCPGTRARLEQSPEQAQERLDKLAGAVRTIFECIGEDPDREGLQQTPERYAKALMFFTKGYEENVRDLVNGAVFQEDHDELVIVRDIEVFSLCEHHMVPFIGKMHIGYIPNRRVLGLSKLARLAEMFSRRLQVQERLTKQVALAIAEVLKPQGVAVVMESSHLCMVMRGVQKTGSSTTTSCMLGAMRSSAKTREEFLSLLNRGK
ncbi:GTP cyclohydrolase 1 [Lithohypha guttulata]|uniref:GTP cyclohydrolase 1 n=1 Tax=Lithohypha guttulata TaxID=1690604 RepID=A0AAN7YJ60_9EURO|nr:GTP cyclohydrolase 1 [Lithohypha guttulata]